MWIRTLKYLQYGGARTTKSGKFKNSVAEAVRFRPAPDIFFAGSGSGSDSNSGSYKTGLPKPPGAAIFGWSRSRFFGPASAPTPTLL